MDNPEKLASLGTQDTGRRQTKETQKKKKHHRKLNKRATRIPPKKRGEPRFL